MRRAALPLVLLLSACSGGPQGAATAPLPVPAAGDRTDLDDVLAGLDAVMGDLQRILTRERRITSEVTDRLLADRRGGGEESSHPLRHPRAQARR